MRRYKMDPRWIRTRYAGTCARCAAPIPAGSEAYWYPLDRILYCPKAACGEAEWRSFESAAQDEDTYMSQYQPYGGGQPW